MLVMLHGRTGVGKSTISRYLAANLEAVVLHTAVVRQELGLSSNQPNAPKYEFKLDDPIFVQTVSPRVYSELLLKAEPIIKSGKTVILDGAYNFSWQREAVYKLAFKLNVPVVILHCVCANEQEIRRRLSVRGKHESDPFAEINDWQTYLSTKFLSDPIDNDCLLTKAPVPKVIFDTHFGTIEKRNCPFQPQIELLIKNLNNYANSLVQS